MRGFDAKELGYTGPDVSASDAIEQANEKYEEMYRAEVAGGREVPIKEIPIELGEDAIYSVEAGDRAIWKANRHSFSIPTWALANYDRIFRRK